MTEPEKLHPQYVTDADGRQTAVILPIEEYQNLLEDLEDLAVVAERTAESTIPHEVVLKKLRDDNSLPG
jgi:hypothetical protein